jgi:hypothetical protein
VKPTSRAVALLQRILKESGLDATGIASELIVRPRDLEGYLSGEREMPLERQLCLALFVIDRLPSLAREGYTLRGQAIASIEYAKRASEPAGKDIRHLQSHSAHRSSSGLVPRAAER